ncbi:hypothetical protein GCM10010519_40410 [Streptomyces lactacystinicus]
MEGQQFGRGGGEFRDGVGVETAYRGRAGGHGGTFRGQGEKWCGVRARGVTSPVWDGDGSCAWGIGPGRLERPDDRKRNNDF